MDIVTHALIGLTIAYPVLPVAPLAGAAFVLGSAAPDLDAFSRLFGKTAFLRAHQTYTHGLPAIAAAGTLAWLVMPATPTLDRFAPVALAAGMLVHTLLDLTNTYGIALFAPVSPRRFSADWLFFIDAPTLILTATALTLEVLSDHPATIAFLYFFAFTLYVAARAALHARARGVAPPDTQSLIPSALFPWRYHGFARTGSTLRIFTLNALTGDAFDTTDLPLYPIPPVVAELPEYRLMASLTPAYHITHFISTTLTIQDLRTRNFGGRFGQLTVALTPEGTIERKEFHV